MSFEENRDQPGSDASVRKKHYGDGKQPWDIIVEAGWGPAFAAANVLKYIRRTKNPEHSFESACWYYRQLVVRGNKDIDTAPQYGRPWLAACEALYHLLTTEELDRIVNQLKAEDGGPTRTSR
jgi:hypothetical protein